MLATHLQADSVDNHVLVDQQPPVKRDLHLNPRDLNICGRGPFIGGFGGQNFVRP